MRLAELRCTCMELTEERSMFDLGAKPFMSSATAVRTVDYIRSRLDYG